MSCLARRKRKGGSTHTAIPVVFTIAMLIEALFDACSAKNTSSALYLAPAVSLRMPQTIYGRSDPLTCHMGTIGACDESRRLS